MFACPLCIIISGDRPLMIRPAFCKHETTSYVSSKYSVCLLCVDDYTCIYCGNVARQGREYIKALEYKKEMLKSTWLGPEIITDLFDQHIALLKNMSRDAVIAEYSKKNDPPCQIIN